MASAHPPADASVCHVHRAADIRACAGANRGDGLDADAPPEPGDTYRLRASARLHRLAAHRDSGTGRAWVAIGSEVGQPGDAIGLVLRLLLIAPSGAQSEVFLLDIGGTESVALVIGALSETEPHTLVECGPPTQPPPLADIAPVGFGRGTTILRADGTPVPVEALRPGDLVLTRDGGPRALRACITTTLRAAGPMAPVFVPAGAIGNSADLVLAQTVRLHLYDRTLSRPEAGPEHLARAGDLAACGLAEIREGGFWTCTGLAFDTHEIVFADSVAAETLLVSGATLERMLPEARAELDLRMGGLRQVPLPFPEASRSVIRRLLPAPARNVAAG